MSEKILFVDDEKDLKLIINQKYKKQIQTNIYEFFFAHNGIEALEVLKEHPEISIILTDINMPEMDGLELLKNVTAMNKPLLKTIIISAYDDMKNIRSAMNNGASDFLTKPLDLNDLTITIENTINQLNQTRNHISINNQLTSIKQDLSVARRIQESFLPKFNSIELDTKHVSVFGAMRSAFEVGGDFYDFFNLDDHRIGFVVGDVSGKGISAAMFMGVTRILLRSAGLLFQKSDECISYVNNVICGDASDNIFVAVLYGILDMNSGDIDFTNAGHTAPFILKKDGTINCIPISNNTVVGVFEDYKYKNSTLKLQNGDMLFICTDGMTEAFNQDNVVYGKERLVNQLSQLIGQSPETIVNTLLQDVIKYEENTKQVDDVTLLAVKFD